MIQARDDASFLLETRGEHGIVDQVLGQHLERDQAVEPRFAHQVHGRCAPAAEARDDGITREHRADLETHRLPRLVPTTSDSCRRAAAQW
jgi:hypothetical protein